MVMLTSLGKYLRTFRIQREELLKDMATSLDVVPAYLSSIENGKRSPTKKLIYKIIETYDLTDEEIDELNKAFYDTLDEISLDTTYSTAMQKDLCISFARKFNSLDDKQIEKIKKILEGSNK